MPSHPDPIRTTEPPILVVLTYGLFPHSLWEPLFAQLSPSLRLITAPPDSAAEVTVAPQGLLRTLETLVAQVPEERPFWILGHSFAANVALAWVQAQKPLHLQGLLLLSPLTGERADPRAQAFSWTTRLIGYRSWIRTQAETHLLSTQATNEQRTQLADALKTLTRRSLALGLEGLLNGLPTPNYQDLSVPVRWMRGEQDLLSQLDIAQRTGGALQAQSLPLAAHLFPYEQPQLTAKWIRAALTKPL